MYTLTDKEQLFVSTEERVGNAHFELKEYDSAIEKYLNNLTFFHVNIR